MHVLPFTTTASAKMLANRCNTIGRILVELNGFPFKISFSLFKSLHIYHIARNHIRNKNHLTFGCFGYRNTFGARIQNCNVFKNNFLGLFSSHSAKINYWLKLKRDLRKKYKLVENYRYANTFSTSSR